MIHSPRFTAVLDACVLYPAPVRDYLLNLADVGLYKPMWSDRIQDEWIRNLLKNRRDLKKASLNKTRDAMNSAFPESNITNYEELIGSLDLPDEKDRHVLAAAIRVRADVIVTSNLKDFPEEYLKTYDIEVQDPDTFISNIISLDIKKALKALNNQVKSLKNPPKSLSEVLDTFGKCGLANSVKLLKE